MKFNRSLSNILGKKQVHRLAIGVLILLLASCVKPNPRGVDPNANFEPTSKANQSAATFFTEKVTGSSVVTKNLEGFSIPAERLFSFRTCVFDKRLRESIKGHKFLVRGGVKEADVRSDESGCINWSESIAFNGTQDAKYILLKRTVIASGMHSGARELSICVNPWNYDGSEAVRDCNREPLPENLIVPQNQVVNYLNGMTDSGDPVKRYLWVDDMRLNSVNNPGGSSGSMIDFSASVGPTILSHNIKGNEEKLPLKDGVFSVQFWIVARTGQQDGRCMVIAKSKPSQELAMTGGRLREELKMKIRYLISYGQLEAVGTIKPKDGKDSILPYHGVWLLGDHSGLLGMKFAFERPPAYKGAPGQFNANEYVSHCIDISGEIDDQKAQSLIDSIHHDGRGIPNSAMASLDVATPETTFSGGGLKTKNLGNGKVEVEVPQALIKSEQVPVPQKVQIDQDLMRNECPDAKDLPRIFPQDNAVYPINPGPDILTCINKNLPGGVYKVEQFEFSLVDARPEPILDPVDSETTIDRKMKFRVTTTVTNPMAQGQPVRDMEFTIETQDGTVTTARTNHMGQLIFNDTLYHYYYQPERFYMKLIRITHASGFSKRIGVVLVPWDNNGFQFARDLRGLTKQTIAQMNLVPRPRSQLLITNFNWGTIGFRYQVDNFLSLKVYKQFLLTVDPVVLRYSSFTHGRMMTERIRDGLYLLKVAIQKDYEPLDGIPQEYINGIRTLVAVRGGRINVPVEIMFRDFRVLKLRANLLIELAAVDERKLPREIREAAFNLSSEANKQNTNKDSVEKLEKDFYNVVQKKTKVKMDSLDSYIAKDSGLNSRTFVGAIVAYSNGFSAGVRATDDLLEVSCPTGSTVDCDELKSNDPIPPSEQSERAKYFGDYKHLFKMSVTRLLERMDILDKKYQQQMSDFTKMSKILHVGNFEYLALNNDARIVAQAKQNDPAFLQNNKSLPVIGGVQRFNKQLSDFNPSIKFAGASENIQSYLRIKDSVAPLSKLKAPLSPQQEFESLRANLFDKGYLDPVQQIKMCVFMMENMILKQDPEQDSQLNLVQRNLLRIRRAEANRYCLTMQPIHLERMLRVFQLYDVERSGGNMMSLSVGASTSVSRSEGWSFGYSLNPAKLLIGGLGAASGIGGALGVVAGGASKFIDNGLGFGMNVSTSKSGSIGDGTSISGQTTLAVEFRRMNLTMGNYERCTSVRLNPEIADAVGKQLSYFLQQKHLSHEDQTLSVSRGLMICEGIARKDPLKVQEQYYQFSQYLGDELLNDPVDLANQPYIFNIRGRSDYVRFIRAIEGRPKSIFKMADHESIGEFPNNRLLQIFADEGTPSYPGVYHLEPRAASKMCNVVPGSRPADLENRSACQK